MTDPNQPHPENGPASGRPGAPGAPGAPASVPPEGSRVESSLPLDFEQSQPRRGFLGRGRGTTSPQKPSRAEKRQARRQAKQARKQRSVVPSPVATSQSPQQASAQKVGSALGHGWWIVLLLAILGGGLAAAAVLALPQRTIGTTTVLVDIPVEATDTEALVRTVETLILSQAVLSDVAEQPGVDLSPAALEDAMQVERATGSAVIEVSVIDTSEERVRAVAEAVIPALQERLGDVDASVTPDPGEDPAAQPGGGTVPLSVTTFGTEPYVRDYSWSLVPSVALGALGGALLGGLVVVVRALRRLPA